MDKTERLQENIEDLTKELDLVKEYVGLIQENAHFSINILGVALGIVIAASGVALFFLVKTMVNQRIEKELDKRLISFLQNNPPLFSADGSAIPDEKKKIYLSSSIEGIDQLELDRVITIEVISENILFNNLSGRLNSKIFRNNDSIIEIEVPDYHENHGLVHWKLVWLRKHYNI